MHFHDPTPHWREVERMRAFILARNGGGALLYKATTLQFLTLDVSIKKKEASADFGFGSEEDQSVLFQADARKRLCCDDMVESF